MMVYFHFSSDPPPPGILIMYDVFQIHFYIVNGFHQYVLLNYNSSDKVKQKSTNIPYLQWQQELREKCEINPIHKTSNFVMMCRTGITTSERNLYNQIPYYLNDVIKI